VRGYPSGKKLKCGWKVEISKRFLMGAVGLAVDRGLVGSPTWASPCKPVGPAL